MKKSFSMMPFVLAFVLTFSSTAVAVNQDAYLRSEAAVQERLETVLQNQLDEMIATESADMDPSSQIESIKVAAGFNGDTYTVTEIFPTGYMIFSDAAGYFTEYSMSAPSPYKGYEENLYYAGPTEYYVAQGENYVHTITGETLSQTEDGESLREFADELSNFYAEESDAAILDFIQNGVDTPSLLSTNATVKEQYIVGQFQINNMNTKSEMSYCSPSGTGGICGYIASAITLAWYDTYIDADIIDNDTYFTKSNGYNVFAGDPNDYTRAGNGHKATFSYNLWKYCSSNPDGNGSVWPNDVAYAINTYLHNNRKISRLTASYSLVPTNTDIINILKRNRPVILLGYLKKEGVSDSEKKNHTVVVYGYKENRLIAHMGWEGYDNVYISGYWAGKVSIEHW